jgi:tetratricopeptide (TPR) repeat protein
VTRKARAVPPPPLPLLAQPLSRRFGPRPLLIFALTVLAYAAAVESPLLFDDQVSIVSNESIRRLTPLQGPLSPPADTPVAGRPLVNLTFAVNYAIDGLGVRGYHVTNLAIHAMVALLLFGVVRRGLGLPRIPAALADRASDVALAVAVIWALHPLNSEVVNYLTQRSESLMALCYLLTVYAAIRALEPDGALRWTVTAILACAAGMASKESMVTAPVMVLLVDRVAVYPNWREALWARRGLYVGLAAGWVVLGAILWTVPRTSVGFDAGTSWWVYLLNQAQLIPRYLGLSFWPRALVLDYGLPKPLAFGDVWLGFTFIGALFVASLIALWRWPLVGLLGAWFFLTLAPASSIVPVATEVGAERRMYLPLMALVVLVVLAVDRVLGRFSSGDAPGVAKVDRRRVAGGAVLAVVCVLLLVGVALRNREYASPLTIAQTIVDRWPNGRGHFLLASELVAAGRQEEALAQFRESAKDYPGALFALGAELVTGGKVDEGIGYLLQFIQAQPEHVVVIPAREMLSSVYLNQNKLDLAAEQLRLLQARVPNHAGAHRLMGDVKLRLDDPAGAVAEYRESLRVRPEQPDVLGNLGFALAALERFDEAAAALREQVVLTPGDPGAHLLLGRVLSVLKKYDEARAEFQAAVELDPDNRDARANLESLDRLLARSAAAAPAALP